MKLPLLRETKVSGKTVFLRADLDVPIKVQSYIEDDTRLMAWMSTLEYLLENGAKVIVGGHLGRPEKISQKSKVKSQKLVEDNEFSLNPVAKWLHKKIKSQESHQRRGSPMAAKVKSQMVGEFEGWRISDSLFLLENLRFYEGEEKNDKEFAKKLASLADIYVNDAFAASHRAHASIVGVPKYLPHFAGFRLQKEIEVMSKVLNNPQRPLVVVVGGAKIETKLPLVEKMHHFADYVLVGGKIAQEKRVLLKAQHEKPEAVKSILFVADLNEAGTDITSKSVENFLQIVNLGKTVVWNGPVGLVQSSKDDTERGTRELAKGIIKSGAYTIIGGGDTIGFLRKIGFVDKFSFVSTGGGAMLEFLSGGKLPGIQALEIRHG